MFFISLFVCLILYVPFLLHSVLIENSFDFFSSNFVLLGCISPKRDAASMKLLKPKFEVGPL